MYQKSSLSRIALSLVLVIVLGLSALVGSRTSVAAQENDRQAQVNVSLNDLGFEFGAVGQWEASLYAGAVSGEETDGRFTEWISAENGQVTLVLPDDMSAGAVIPWDETDSTYVRLRTVDDDAYPLLDLVSEPFTLADRLYTVVFDFDQSVTREEADSASVEVALGWGADFGDVAAWEASLYKGPNIGQETDGRFTEWLASVNGVAVITLPDDLQEDAEAPFLDAEGIYIRVRSTNDTYPEFDLVGLPFILTDNEITTVMLTLTRGVTDEALPVEPAEDTTEDTAVTPPADPPAPAPAPPVERPPIALPEDPAGYTVYTVVAGDTLSDVARRAYGDGTRYPTIVAATNSLAAVDPTLNTVVDPDLIIVGWRIAIPGPEFLPEPVVDVDEEMRVSVPTDARHLVGNRAGAYDTFHVSSPETTDVTITMWFAPADPTINDGIGFNVWGEGRLITEGQLVDGAPPREALFTIMIGEVYEIQIYNYIDGHAIIYQLSLSQ